MYHQLEVQFKMGQEIVKIRQGYLFVYARFCKVLESSSDDFEKESRVLPKLFHDMKKLGDCLENVSRVLENKSEYLEHRR